MRLRLSAVAALTVSSLIISIAVPNGPAFAGDSGGFDQLTFDDPDPLPAATEELVEPGDTVTGNEAPFVPAPEPQPDPPPPAPPVWPEPAEVEVEVTSDPPPPGGDERSLVHVDGYGTAVALLPLEVWRAPGGDEGDGDAVAGDSLDDVSAVTAEVLSAEVVAELGGIGLAFRLTRADGVGVPGDVTVDAVYDAFRTAAGGDLASRLDLVSLPACALTTPEEAACRAESPIEVVNHRDEGFLRAVVQAAADPAADGGRAQGLADDDPPVYLVDSNPAGLGGDFAASPLSPTGDWSVGLGSGDFRWSESLPVVPLPQGGTGSGPALQYNSASVDGRTAAKNPQASWAGLGWDLQAGSVTQTFTPCSEVEGAPDYDEDSCIYDAVGRYSISLNGQTSPLVRLEGTTNDYRLRNDPGWRVTHVFDGHPSYWRVETPDGTDYLLGFEPTGESINLNGRWTVPTRNPGNGYAWSDEPWQWALTVVHDASGNETMYYYEYETNHFAGSDDVNHAYVRAGNLDKIEFGRRKDSALPPTAILDYTTQYRCVDLDNTCTPPTSASVDFPDVPVDMLCDGTSLCSETTPTFFTARRPELITSRVANGAGWLSVESVNFEHGFYDDQSDPEDVIGPQLWLEAVQRTGHGSVSLGDEVPLPVVYFSATPLPNRADAIPAVMPRLNGIETTLGGRVTVTYGLQNPCPETLPVEQGPLADYDCFVAYGTLDDSETSGFVWYHKHLVMSVVEAPMVGLAEPPESQIVKTTSYVYNGVPQIHHDDNDAAPVLSRGWGIWRGYGEVEVLTGDPAGTRTRDVYKILRGMHGDHGSAPPFQNPIPAPIVDIHGNTYDDHEWFNGRTYEHRRYDGSTLVEWTTTKPDWGRLAPNPDITDRTSARMVVDLLTTTTVDVPGGTDRTSRTQNTFEQTYGLLQSTQEFGDVVPGTDDRCETTSYAINNTLWLQVPSDQRTWVGTSCETGVVAARTRTFYESSGGLPIRPMPTEIREYDTSTTYSSTEKVYDNYGRLTSVVDPNDNETETTYTPLTGQPTSSIEENALGHDVTTTYALAWGKPASVTDANGHVTTLSFDALGRLAKVWRPTEPTSGPASIVHEYSIVDDAPPRVRTRTLQSHDNAPVYVDEFTFYDGLGRTRQTQIVAPTGDGRIVTATRYDSRGLVAAEAEPMHMAGTAGANLTNPDLSAIPAETRTTYDGLERPKKVATYSDGAAVPGMDIETDYFGTYSTVTPPRGMQITTHIDAFGRTSQVTEHYGQPDPPYAITPYDTTYTYDVLDNLTSITDELGFVTTYGYDMQSRRVSSDDPDAGEWTYSYDPAGNRIETTDAEQQVIIGVFDELNRQVELRKSSTTGTLLASWDYDAAGRKGLLIASTAREGGQNYTLDNLTYDARDRLTSKRYVIPAPSSVAGNYTFSYGYDRADHRTSITYPAAGGLSSETVTTAFSGRGYEVSTAGDGVYIAETTYKNYGLLARRDYGGAGNLIRKYSYATATRWLDNLRTEFDSQTIQDTEVGHDLGGNVTRLITSATHTPGTPTVDECFSYDSADRLISAHTRDGTSCTTGNVGAGPHGYDDIFRYDAIHRLKTRSKQVAPPGFNYTYDYFAGSKHAISGERFWGGGPPPNDPPLIAEYVYDDNGHRVAKTDGADPADDETHYTWNARRLLTRAEVTESGQTTASDYVYDADGSRLIRDDNAAVTLYLDNMELTATGSGTTATRYYTTAEGVIVGLRQPNQPRVRVLLRPPRLNAILGRQQRNRPRHQRRIQAVRGHADIHRGTAYRPPVPARPERRRNLTRSTRRAVLRPRAAAIPITGSAARAVRASRSQSLRQLPEQPDYVHRPNRPG